MSERYCCPECFDDQVLRKEFFPSNASSFGRCSYCGSEDVALVEPAQLADVFEMLLSVYEPDANGKSLVEWMKEDWRLFSHPKMDNAHAKELLGEILNDGEIVRQSFSPSAAYKSDGLIRWESLREELMFKNRYFLDETIDADRLEKLLRRLLADDMPKIWYRSRIQTNDTPFPITDMGAPPKQFATHGRANPSGIPYLYLGSKPETAAAEVRPHTGEVACVADFKIDALVACDLRDPRKLVSPFNHEVVETIGQMRADIPFLERLGEELTRPVLQRSAAIDYLPSQYLCEFIKKKCNFDGVVYRSSVSDGINLALFNPTKAVAGSVSQFNVARVSVEVVRIA